MTAKQIIKRAEEIDEMLKRLQAKADKLAEEIAIYGDEVDYDDYIYRMQNLKYALEELANFDLEDSIPE